MHKIKIKNFQSLKDVSFDVDGFTVIVGESDVGKSAIVRSIDNLIFNIPGKEVIRTGEELTKIELQTEDHKLSLSKFRSKTSLFTLDKESFSAAGRSQLEVFKDLGFRFIEIPNSSQKLKPQIASQFDQPFLLFETGSVRAQVLGQFGSMQQIDLAIKAVGRDIKETSKQLEVEQEVLSRFERRKDVWTKFNTISIDPKPLLTSIIDSFTKYSEILLLIKERGKLNQKIQLLTKLTTITIAYNFDKITNTLSMIANITKLLTLHTSLRHFVDSGITLSSIPVDFGLDMSTVQSRFSKISLASSRKSHLQSVSTLTKDFSSCFESLSVINKSLSEIEFCPLCNSKLNL